MSTGLLIIAQTAGGPLTGLEGNTRLAAVAAVIAVAAALAWQSGRAGAFGLAAVTWLAGLAVAAAGGFLLEDMPTALVAASLYATAGAAFPLYTLAREQWEVGFWGVVAALGVVGVMAFGDVKTGAFIAAGTLIIFSALKVLASPRLVHAALWLAGVLVGIAGIFLSTGAELLAAVQILVYVGAVITLFLFTVMLTVPEEDVHGLDELELPPGVTVDDVTGLDPATPMYGHGPYKGFTETNPRKPVRAPPTLYGVSITDGVYGTEDTVRRKAQKDEENAEGK